jgi:hypothetical protein
MGAYTPTAIAERLAPLERHVRRYRRLSLGLGLLMLIGVCMAAQTPPDTSPVLRATRLEIVDDAGRVVFSAEAQKGGGMIRVLTQAGKAGVVVAATDLGGRLEVLNREGQEMFSVGTQSGTTLSGLWERERRATEQQRRELDQLRQDLVQTTRQLRTFEPPARSGSDGGRLEQMVDQQRRDLDQQRRELDQQRRLIDALERQIRYLEHR